MLEIISILDIKFWIYFLYFIIAIFIAFYIPGYLIINRLKLNILSESVLSIIIGLVLLSLQGFLLGYLNLRILSFVYLFFCLVVFIKKGFYFDIKSSISKIKFFSIDKILAVIILLGTLVQLSSVWLNGAKLKEGLYFCCGVPDTLFHLSLTSELVKQFPPNEPGISGILLQNYHYLSNLATSELIRIFNLPLIHTQYQYMALVLSLLLGLSAVVLADILKLGSHFKRWFVFLLYFTGDIIFLLPFFYGNGINFSVTTLENASSLWVSPPRFYALILLIGAFSLLALWLKRKDFWTGVAMAVIGGSLIGFKVYIGAIFLGGLGILGVKYFLQKKFKLLLPIIITFFISLAIYLPVNSGAGGLIFTGFWRFEDFVVQPSLGISSFELARRVYLDHHSWLRVLQYDLLFALLYIVFSSGILLLGFLQTKKSITKLPFDFNLVLISGLAITCILGFFFIQKTGGANSSQFLISIYIVGAIFTALAISYWLGKLNTKWILLPVILFIIISSIRVVYETSIRVKRIVNKELLLVDNSTLDAYKSLANRKEDGVVLVENDYQLDCIYITFISNKQTFDCSVGAPADRGVDLTKRQQVKKNILFGKNLKVRKELLLSNNIKYIYLPNDDHADNKVKGLGFNKFYDNASVVIYKSD